MQYVRYRNEGRSDEIKEVYLDLKNTPLVKVLKEFMPECDELHEESVTINAQHVFRHWQQVEAALNERKTRLAVLSGRSTRDIGVSTDEVNPEAEKKGKKNKILEYSVEDLETQIDEIQILLACKSPERSGCTTDGTAVMEEEYSPVQKKLERLKARGMISFDLLWTQFKVESQVTGTHEDSGLPVRLPQPLQLS